MDEIREVTRERIRESLEKGVPPAVRDRIEAMARSMQQAGYEPSAVGAIALEGIIDLLGFERGFLLEVREAGRGAADEELPPLEPIASRARRPGGGQGEWTSVRNPEFAVSRSVVKRALASGRAIAINDCLLEPTGQSEAQHRAVLCQTFDMAPGVKAVVYLDRELGRGELGEAEPRALEELGDRCGAVLACAHALSRLARLEARLESLESLGAPEPEDAASGDAPASVPPEEVPIFQGIVGKDEKLLKIFEIVRKVRDSDLNICIHGESGTGKELLARAIHATSRRRERLFVAENCGAIPENLLESELFGHTKGSFTGADEDKKGLFELADGGTLFLDEISDMSEGMQRKLLRVLQEGVIRPVGGKHPVKVDVRVLCASNRDLKSLVEKGMFRADLFYRLNVITIEIPPLRDRPGDIPLLVSHLGEKIAEEEGVKKRFTQSAMKTLREYPWPGNIRELRNVIRRALVTCPRRLMARKDIVGFLSEVKAAPRAGENIERDGDDLILRVPARDSFNEVIEECERVVIHNALKQCAWNKSRVTKALKIPRQSLYNKLARYKLERHWSPELARDEEA